MYAAIPTANIARLNEAFTKLAKRAAKLNVAAPSYIVVGTELQEVANKQWLEYTLLEVEETVVKLNGWQFVATLEHTIDGNIYHNVPGAYNTSIPFYYRSVGTLCEHCGKNRKRNDTYLLQHENGSFKQVGKSCLKDFLGHTSPERIVQFLQSIEEEINECKEYREPREVTFIDTLLYLANVNAVIRERGWKPAQAEKPTKEVALGNYFLEGKKDAIEPTEQDHTIAEQAFMWIAQQDVTGEYMTNLKLACADRYIKTRNIGLVASLIPAYLRAMELTESTFVGSVKDKLNLSVTLVSKTYIDSMYGTTVLHKFVDTNGNILVWFASRDTDCDIDNTVTLAGTVKDHQEYNGIKQTVLTRCKVS